MDRQQTRRYLPWMGLGAFLALLVIIGIASSRSEPDATNQVAEESEEGFLESILPEPNREVTVPAGTVIALALQQPVSSATSSVGDAVLARVTAPVMVGGDVVIPAGSTVEGRVVQAQRSKRIGGRARLGVEFSGLTLPSGEDVPLSASFYSVSKSQTKKDAATIGGSTVGGAILGRVIGHKNDDEGRGTAIGAVVGGAVGTAVASSNRAKDVTIPAGSAVQVRLDQPVTVSVEA